MTTLEHDLEMKALIEAFRASNNLIERHSLLLGMTPMARGWAQTCGSMWPGEEAAAKRFALWDSGRPVGPTFAYSQRERELGRK
jgi:hypothetical protein